MSHEGTGPTGQEPLDRKALLLEQFNEVEAAPAAETAKPDTQKLAAALETAPAGRARDEAGKFVPKEKTAAVEAAPQVAALVTPPAWEQPPKSWKKEYHDYWKSADPKLKEYALQRETEMKASYDAAAPKAELADKLTQAAEPYMNTIRGLGLDLPAAVSGLMKVDHDLRTLPHEQKLAVLSQVARGYGIDLSGQLPTQIGDPGVQAIQNELLAIKGQFTSFTQAQEAAQQRTAQEEIQNFAKTVEHFEDVKPVMAQLLQSGMAEGIKDAYEKAIRLNPDLFDQIQTAKQVAADADKRKAADDAAKRAKAAAVSVKSATPGTAKPTNAQDRRSMLAEQFNGLSERL